MTGWVARQSAGRMGRKLGRQRHAGTGRKGGNLVGAWVSPIAICPRLKAERGITGEGTGIGTRSTGTGMEGTGTWYNSRVAGGATVEESMERIFPSASPLKAPVWHWQVCESWFLGLGARVGWRWGRGCRRAGRRAAGQRFRDGRMGSFLQERASRIVSPSSWNQDLSVPLLQFPLSRVGVSLRVSTEY